jgi:hypothetical protein
MDVFLPQLLRYPNPADPLNGEAARLLLDNEERYRTKVREHVLKHASLNFQIDYDENNMKSETSSSIGTSRKDSPEVRSILQNTSSSSSSYPLINNKYDEKFTTSPISIVMNDDCNNYTLNSCNNNSNDGDNNHNSNSNNDKMEINDINENDNFYEDYYNKFQYKEDDYLSDVSEMSDL